MTTIAITLSAPKNWQAIRDLIDTSNLTVHEALWVARQILGASMSTVDREQRESFLRAYMLAVLEDVAEHDKRRYYKVGEGEELC